MAATLSLDTITSSGAGITIDATKTFTVNGSLLSAGSSNILRKTGDYTILEADVSGKSELVIATNASAGTRTITLPAVATTGLSTCIITIVADADATSTYKLMVQDTGTTEVWTGYQKNDFVRLIVSNSAWVVVDHKETYFAHRYLTANSGAIAASATTKLTGWTSVTEVGNAWDNTNNKLTTPTGMNGYWTVSWNNAANVTSSALVPNLFIGGASVSNYAQAGTDTYGYRSGQNGVTGRYYATSTQDVEFYIVNFRDSSTYIVAGGSVSSSHFTAQFERVY
jgi:hypothetical protein